MGPVGEGFLQERQSIIEHGLGVGVKLPKPRPANPQKNRAAMEAALSFVLPPAPKTFEELRGDCTGRS